ncbi:Lactamase-B domain-containing protein [Aphelenchoides besseyi]|nr:Lactamase-B domain-containing protein [Aphelenchoides besseyi]
MPSPTSEFNKFMESTRRLLLQFVLFALISTIVRSQNESAQKFRDLAGLSLDELEMLEDFELRQLRDAVRSRGHGSVARAVKDEEIDLFKEQSPEIISKGSEAVELTPPSMVNPFLIKMPDEEPKIENKKHRLKSRRKNLDKPKKDEQQTHTGSGGGGSFSITTSNGIREDDNRSDNLTGEDYEKLAKLLQSFVNRRKQTTLKNEENHRPVITTTEFSLTRLSTSSSHPTLSGWPLASSGLPPWAVTRKPKGQNVELFRGLSMITEQQDREQATFVVEDSMEKPEPASVWRNGNRIKSTTASPLLNSLAPQVFRKFDVQRPENTNNEESFPIVDSEVTQNPVEWEAKMKQLSKELSSILHKLKNDKEERIETGKSNLKVVAEIFESTTPTLSLAVDGHVGELEEPTKDETVDSDSNSESANKFSIGTLKISKQKSTNKAYVTILREVCFRLLVFEHDYLQGIARQTDINEYVFIASITLIRDDNKVILVDTGLATDINGRTDLLTRKLDITPPDVNYVILTHAHPDHAGGTNDFLDAYHYQGSLMHHRSKFNFSELFEKDHHQLTKNVHLIRTPGHTPEDVTVLVKNTDKYGTIAVCGDVFITAEDIEHPIMWKPMAWSERTQETSRRRLICEADYIVPGAFVIFSLVFNINAQWNGDQDRKTAMRWGPYPPQFENVLPQEAKDQLMGIYNNTELTHEERMQQMDAVYDSLPTNLFTSLPLPEGFNNLPEVTLNQIKIVHSNPNLRYSERRQQIRSLLDSVPYEQRRAAFKGTFFPPMPPPGFESVLSPTVYKQLLSVHRNPQLSAEQKKQQADRIMQQVPADQLKRLPLPFLFDKLPIETQQRIRSIIHNFRMPWDRRRELLHEFIHSLPVEERRVLRPPLPTFVSELPSNIKAQLEAIHNDDNLKPWERFQRFRQVMQTVQPNPGNQFQQSN